MTSIAREHISRIRHGTHRTLCFIHLALICQQAEAEVTKYSKTPVTQKMYDQHIIVKYSSILLFVCFYCCKLTNFFTAHPVYYSLENSC